MIRDLPARLMPHLPLRASMPECRPPRRNLAHTTRTPKRPWRDDCLSHVAPPRPRVVVCVRSQAPGPQEPDAPVVTIADRQRLTPKLLELSDTLQRDGATNLYGEPLPGMPRAYATVLVVRLFTPLEIALEGKTLPAYRVRAIIQEHVKTAQRTSPLWPSYVPWLKQQLEDIFLGLDNDAI